MKLKKRAFNPKVRKMTCEELGMDGYDHTFLFRADPNKRMLVDSLRMLQEAVDNAREEKEIEDVEKFDEEFHELACFMIIDCDIEGVDFSTPESTRDAFSRKDIDDAFFTKALINYLTSLLIEATNLKKTQMLTESDET